MITPAELADAFARNVRVIRAQADGLSHEDSLIQPPFRGNCLNWVLGHVVGSRNELLEALGQPAVMPAAQYVHYDRGSEPVTQAGEQVLPLAELLSMLDESQVRLADALGGSSAADMAREVKVGERTTGLGKWAFFLYFHETYHVGQTELLRQLAGKNDQVI